MGWCDSTVSNRRMHLAVSSLRGKLGGLHTCAATFRYIVPLPNIFLTRLFSKLRLKRKDFQEIVRLTWAQECNRRRFVTSGTRRNHDSVTLTTGPWKLKILEKSRVPDTFQLGAFSESWAFCASRFFNKLRVFNKPEYS